MSKLIASLSYSSHIYRPSNNVDIGTGTAKIILDGYRSIIRRRGDVRGKKKAITRNERNYYR